MVRATALGIWHEPAAPDARRWSRWDWLTIPLLIAFAVGEAVAGARDHPPGSPHEAVVPWPVAAVVVAVAITVLMVMRRVHPLRSLVLAWTVVVAFHIALLGAGLYATMVGGPTLFLALYAVVRWASGREVVAGVGVTALGVVLVGTTASFNVGEMVAGVIFWVMPIPLGIAIRMAAGRQTERLHEVRLEERHQLARELHDTVAHHVSAIAIQAQAGQAVFAQRPDAAIDALAAIEDAASRTLTEMRRMVTVLRDAEQAELEPQRGLDDIRRLAAAITTGPRIDIAMLGDLDDLAPSVQAGLYRLAQESVTNARRHARYASRIVVEINGHDNSVHLEVSDDGAPVAAGPRLGFGLVGMAERAKLLGGDLYAGPGVERGWVVAADLPKVVGV